MKDGWRTAFHGTWWYALWGILQSGVLLESNDLSRGHEFSEPGVYVSPRIDTARWYARPQVVFGDGVFHRVIVEVRVDLKRSKKKKKSGGVQWVFPSAAVSIYAVRVQINAPPQNGEERIKDWSASLEAVADGNIYPPAIVNPRKGPWPDINDEGSEERVSAVPVPLRLRGSVGFSVPAHVANERARS